MMADTFESHENSLRQKFEKLHMLLSVNTNSDRDNSCILIDVFMLVHFGTMTKFSPCNEVFSERRSYRKVVGSMKSNAIWENTEGRFMASCGDR